MYLDQNFTRTHRLCCCFTKSPSLTATPATSDELRGLYKKKNQPNHRATWPKLIHWLKGGKGVKIFRCWTPGSQQLCWCVTFLASVFCDTESPEAKQQGFRYTLCVVFFLPCRFGYFFIWVLFYFWLRHLAFALSQLSRCILPSTNLNHKQWRDFENIWKEDPGQGLMSEAVYGG